MLQRIRSCSLFNTRNYKTLSSSNNSFRDHLDLAKDWILSNTPNYKALSNSNKVELTVLKNSEQFWQPISCSSKQKSADSSSTDLIISTWVQGFCGLVPSVPVKASAVCMECENL